MHSFPKEKRGSSQTKRTLNWPIWNKTTNQITVYCTFNENMFITLCRAVSLVAWRSELLCSWFRVSQVYINKSPTGCNSVQSVLFYCKITLHVSGVIRTHHREYIKLYKTPTWPGRPDLATLEGGSCTDIMTCTGGCRYSFMYSWWWVRMTLETCGVILQ
jgi:hypothetical protein